MPPKIAGTMTGLLLYGSMMTGACAAGGSDSDTFQVTMTITKACTVTAGSSANINLGSVYSTAVNTSGSSSIGVACSPNTAYYVGLAPSDGSMTGAGAMISTVPGNADQVPYQLYADPHHTIVWGNTATSRSLGNGVTGTGTGINHAAMIPVYAVAPSADFTPGNYTDIVTVNVNF